jgi:maltose/moltooligosaccharide transporter
MGQPKKPSLSFWQIVNMNVGFFGIQYSFGLQQSAVNPIYDFLGAKPHEIPWLNLAGPLTGLIIQPIIGALSDKTWSPKWGRRKPYFLIGAIMCSIALFVFPYSSSLWMAAGLLWILDVGNNTAMEPYRAFVADKLNENQYATGFQAQSFFTGLGQTLANFSLLAFPLLFMGKTGSIPNWVFASFILGSICSVLSILWSVKTTTEITPSEEELRQIRNYNSGKPNKLVQFFVFVLVVSIIPLLFYVVFKNIINGAILNMLLLPVGFGSCFFAVKIIKQLKNVSGFKLVHAVCEPLIEVIDGIKAMPKIMWMLSLLYLFQWYALFCYWQNASKCVAANTYGWQSINTSKALKDEVVAFNKFEQQVIDFVKNDHVNAKKQIQSFGSASALAQEFNVKLGTDVKVSDSLDIVYKNNQLYEEAVSQTGGINGWYNIVTFLVAFLLAWLTKQYAPKWVHATCLLLTAIGFIIFSQVQTIPLFYAAITGFGIGWASMMGIPYLMVVHAIPKEKYGLYMGIINMMIVVPMFIQTVTFGSIMQYVLDNNSSHAILFAGILLIIAAAVTSLIETNTDQKNDYHG